MLSNKAFIILNLGTLHINKYYLLNKNRPDLLDATNILEALAFNLHINSFLIYLNLNFII